MRSLPLFRFNKRARSTSWGIALCTMFIVASFSIASGLRSSMDTLSDNFSSELSLVTFPGTSGIDFFESSALVEVEDRSAMGVLAVSSAGPDHFVVFAVHDPAGVLGEALAASGHDVKVGASVPLSGQAVLESETSQEVTVVGRFSSALFSPDWILGSLELLLELTDRDDGSWNFAVVRSLTADERDSLESAGFSVQPMVSIVEFLDSSVAELEADAFWVLVPSAFVIAVLAYSFIGAEVADRRHDIGIIKTIGAGRRRVFGYLMAESALICAYGGALGLALGIVMSYAVSTVASHMFTSVFVIEIQETLLVASYLVTVAAGVAGALIPSARMTVSSPVSDLREVGTY